MINNFSIKKSIDYFQIEYLPLYCPNQEERRDPKLYASNVRTKVAHHLSVPLANVAMEDRFNKKNKENLSDNEENIQENNTGEKDIELLTIESTKENNNTDQTDSTKIATNGKSESPLLGSTSNPTMDFSGTINYI